jgi:hypothetical protein
MKKKFLTVLAVWALVRPLFAEPLRSPTWGFSIDLPEGYEYAAGDGQNRFSFSNGSGAALDLVVYNPGKYRSVSALAQDVKRQLKSSGQIWNFQYHGKNAAFLELKMKISNANYSGYALAVELQSEGGSPPLLAALAYGPASAGELLAFHFSALDSVAPSPGDRLLPGPVTEFAYPRKSPVQVEAQGLGFSFTVDENDAEAAKSVVDREFMVLSTYTQSQHWQFAWRRFYRMVYRDSYDRLADLSFRFERKWYAEEGRDLIFGQGQPGLPALQAEKKAQASLAQAALTWVQGFNYERDTLGSDFVDLVSAASGARGDCDSRAMLWAVILRRNNVPSAIMVSREYSHAMGLARIENPGATFSIDGEKWLVAETTAKVNIGRIAREQSDTAKWLGVPLEW